MAWWMNCGKRDSFSFTLMHLLFRPFFIAPEKGLFSRSVFGDCNVFTQGPRLIYILNLFNTYLRYFLPGLGSLRDLRFADVEETSAVVYWTVPRTQPDSYRITYIPIQGGERPCPYDSMILWLCVVFSEWILFFRYSSHTDGGWDTVSGSSDKSDSWRDVWGVCYCSQRSGGERPRYRHSYDRWASQNHMLIRRQTSVLFVQLLKHLCYKHEWNFQTRISYRYTGKCVSTLMKTYKHLPRTLLSTI